MVADFKEPPAEKPNHKRARTRTRPVLTMPQDFDLEFWAHDWGVTLTQTQTGVPIEQQQRSISLSFERARAVAAALVRFADDHDSKKQPPPSEQEPG